MSVAPSRRSVKSNLAERALALKARQYARIALPLGVGRFGGAPALVWAIDMLPGFRGAPPTPPAANFNLVPAALLQLKGRYAVIRAQAPTAVPMLIVNVIPMNALAFHAGRP